MSSTTPRVGIKTWDGSDPFLRSDFSDNFRKIDNFLTAYICTSTTRPSWGASQAGMKILETDTRRELMWSGTAWRELLQSAPMYQGWARPFATLYSGSVANYTCGTITVHRPTDVLIAVNAELATYTDFKWGYSVYPTINGNACAIGAGGNYATFPNIHPSGHGIWWSQQVSNLGSATLAPGTHSYGVGVAVWQQGLGGAMFFQMARAAMLHTNINDS